MIYCNLNSSETLLSKVFTVNLPMNHFLIALFDFQRSEKSDNVWEDELTFGENEAQNSINKKSLLIWSWSPVDPEKCQLESV